MNAAASRPTARPRPWRSLGALLAGPILAILGLVLLPTQFELPSGEMATFSLAGRATLSLLGWMAVWWLTEAVHLSITALLPLCVLPLVAAIDSGDASGAMKAAATPYAHPLIGLFMGGFLVALSMQKWRLHERIALIGLRMVGTRPSSMVAGLMATTAIMSMWVSNTATAVMMLPVALSIADLGPRDDPVNERLTRCLLLGIAYSASVGGVGTLIGTPPNAMLAGFVESTYGVQIGFARWMLIGVPVMIILLPLIWLLLTRVLNPVGRAPIAGGRAAIIERHEALGRPNAGEWSTFVVFMLMSIAWITRPWLVQIQLGGVRPLAGLTDTGIALIAAITLFVIPMPSRREFVMDWETAKKLPWGVLLLFGGGLSIAGAVKAHQVDQFIGSFFGTFAGAPAIVVVAIVVVTIVLLTELTSNTATTAALLPILAGLAPVLGVDSGQLLVAAAIAASCAFMMPVATPPNAIVFGSERLRIADMARAGAVLNVIASVVVCLFAVLVVRLVLQIEPVSG